MTTVGASIIAIFLILFIFCGAATAMLAYGQRGIADSLILIGRRLDTLEKHRKEEPMVKSQKELGPDQESIAKRVKMLGLYMYDHAEELVINAGRIPAGGCSIELGLDPSEMPSIRINQEVVPVPEEE